MKVLFIALLAIMARECKSSKNQLPGCINDRIEQIKIQPKWNPPAEVHEYSYNGKRVFYFSSPCCDQYNELYDEDCKYICAPSGGLTGKGDQKCTDFLQQAKHIRLVWKDER